ncbi:hypothetical protein PanWU01x14_304480 [Parasponia andersonii]|uniref:Uncharacterized protein n=1 Tax=Parasponia andersonii TaxID=3476 RepID=A0A2P5ASH1_PARAD|nr:hypothetical protein PanWU01x14_304480 [Parasponia andersonii]
MCLHGLGLDRRSFTCLGDLGSYKWLKCAFATSGRTEGLSYAFATSGRQRSFTCLCDLRSDEGHESVFAAFVRQSSFTCLRNLRSDEGLKYAFAASGRTEEPSCAFITSCRTKVFHVPLRPRVRRRSFTCLCDLELDEGLECAFVASG